MGVANPYEAEMGELNRIVASSPIIRSRKQISDERQQVKNRQAAGDKDALAMGDPGETIEDELHKHRAVANKALMDAYGDDVRGFAGVPDREKDDFLREQGMVPLSELDSAWDQINKGKIRASLFAGKNVEGGRLFEGVKALVTGFKVGLLDDLVADLASIVDPEWGENFRQAIEYSINPEHEAIAGVGRVVGGTIPYLLAGPAASGIGLTAKGASQVLRAGKLIQFGKASGTLGAIRGIGQARHMNRQVFGAGDYFMPGVSLPGDVPLGDYGKAVLNVLLRAGLGFTEGVGVGSMLGKLNGRTNGYLAKSMHRLVRAGEGKPTWNFVGNSLEEGIQEMGNQGGQNAVDIYLLDLEKDLSDGMLTTFAAGGAMGGILGTVLSRASMASQRKWSERYKEDLKDVVAQNMHHKSHALQDQILLQRIPEHLRPRSWHETLQMEPREDTVEGLV